MGVVKYSMMDVTQLLLNGNEFILRHFALRTEDFGEIWMEVACSATRETKRQSARGTRPQ